MKYQVKLDIRFKYIATYTVDAKDEKSAKKKAVEKYRTDDVYDLDLYLASADDVYNDSDWVDRVVGCKELK